jgi:DSF synthase
MTFLSPAADRDFVHSSVPAPSTTLAAARFETLETRMEVDTASFWAFMNPGAKPSFTRELLRDLLAQQALLRDTLAPERRIDGEASLRYYVLGSRLPGIFNLGGDLGHFAERIRQRDLTSLRRYGHLCVEAIHGNAEAFRAPVVTIALVQGDALGGGFECALAFDVIVAERSAKFGLPEILFNLFPGMGAYSFLSRRIGQVQAERMIMSGKIYSAEELHALGIVDVLAEDGQGEAAVRDYIDRNSRKHNAQQALMRVRRRVNPVTLAELKEVVEIWAETALGVSEMDLRKMVRLTQAQEKRIAAAAAERQALAS